MKLVQITVSTYCNVIVAFLVFIWEKSESIKWQNYAELNLQLKWSFGHFSVILFPVKLFFPGKFFPTKIKLYREIDSIYKVFKGISKLTYLYTIYIQLERCNWSLSLLVS